MHLFNIHSRTTGYIETTVVNSKQSCICSTFTQEPSKRKISSVDSLFIFTLLSNFNTLCSSDKVIGKNCVTAMMDY